jgi:malonyl-CoA/methylmalonyl-CoA synthetase
VARLPEATVFMGVPTLYVRLLAEPGLTKKACRKMRLFIAGSAPLLIETFHEWQARTGHTILERYGMSETAMLTSNPYSPVQGERRGGTVGFALPGVQLRVRIAEESGESREAGTDEIGNIEVDGPNVFSGYWRMPEKTAEEFTADGWFRTGDVGRTDPDGRLWISGRAKDLIISGGYNVYPKEIELLLDTLDGIAESAVIGVPHRDFGEAVVAVVTGIGDEADLIAQARTRLAAFKAPKRILFADDLPRNAMGKVQKNVLRERYAGLFG